LDIYITFIDMKKLLMILAAAIIPMIAGAQAQILTKKVKISDFTEKMTKVVLTGNEMFDLSLQDEVKARWRVSPYEFCTWEEFMNDRNSSDYYFLLTTSGQFKKETEPALDMFSLVKGGTGATINSMMEVMFLPFASAEDPSGREFVFLPVLLDIIQDHTLKSMEKDMNGYVGLSGYSTNMTRTGHMQIVFSEDDLNSEITREYMDINFDSDIVVTDEDTADIHIFENTPNTLVSYVVAPTNGNIGSYCYKMLINAQTHEIYYFSRHKISKKYGVGFLTEDIKRINSYRNR
jgi:hypothetical protein